MLEKKYYKQDLCIDAGRCKLYNPLLTQGQCEYYNKMCELLEEVAIYKRALDLVCEDISLYEDITTPELKAKCYLAQAKKELEKENKDERN